jgi:hypothetical protein
MRSGTEIAEQIRRKAEETVKNEVIALSEEEFVEISRFECPNGLGLSDYKTDGNGKCYINTRSCQECWKKATRRK